MNLRHFMLAGICAAGAICGARAAGAAEVIYDGSGFLQGQQSFTDSFNVSGPGTLTVTLSNVAWPEQLASLSLVLGSAKGLLGPEMGAGTESFNITAGGRLFAQWFGTAQGPLDVGVYSMKIMFRPQGEMAVPLPTSLALLGSGLALLVWQRPPLRIRPPSDKCRQTSDCNETSTYGL